MSDHDALDLDSDTTHVRRPGQLSANGHWVFGSIYAGLALVGFSFGVWAGAAKPKPVEVAEAKKEPEKPAPAPSTKGNSPAPAPVVQAPVPPVPVTPGPVEPMPNETPEPKPKDPPEEIKPKPPEPKPAEPKPKEPDPKATAPAKAVAFKEVQPILRAYCAECHGASAGKPKGGVDVTTLAKLLKSKGPPVVAGKPDESSLYLSTKSGDMPPDGKKGPNAKELQLLHDWIASGAKERRRPVRVRRAIRTARRVELTPGGGAE